ncbi:MAG: outer membrane beta-barrel protein [Chitinophagaceae bacterium]|nr:outer membrane beta-barrel protein [Chitinophagaceae bacterium]
MIKPTLMPVFSLFTLCFSTQLSYSQLNLSKWQVGVNGGVFVYQGDLTPSALGSYRTLSPGFGLYVSRILSPSFILRTNFARGSVKGADAAYASPWWRKERNFKFSSPVTEISELLVWNILRNNGNEEGYRFSPYVYGGAGVSILKVSRDYSGMNPTVFAENTEVMNGLAADMAKRPPRATLVVPLGAGVEYYLTPKISLTAETAFRYTFTDYLDGFSQSANPKRKDYYHSHTVGLVYKFGSKSQYDCPAVAVGY